MINIYTIKDSPGAQVTVQSGLVGTQNNAGTHNSGATKPAKVSVVLLNITQALLLVGAKALLGIQ